MPPRLACCHDRKVPGFLVAKPYARIRTTHATAVVTDVGIELGRAAIGGHIIGLVGDLKHFAVALNNNSPKELGE